MDKPVLILGAGINGAAVARELALNGVSVVVVDTADLAFGATAYSSRLIHGGLRYLEYGEFSLVKESLQERARLLTLAPHLVQPLRLFIPSENYLGGMVQSAARFVGLKFGGKPAPRGSLLVRFGLAMYDAYARDPRLPKRSLHALGEPGTPAGLNPKRSSWLSAYSDCQIVYAERIVVAFLADAVAAAAERGQATRVLTYHRAAIEQGRVVIRPVEGSRVPETIEPAAIINATGAWVDETLARLPVPSQRLMGGTKGSHFITWHADLRERIGDSGIYAEAADGRPVFVLPFPFGTLVGTTDLPFDGDPANAVATEEELEYLLSVVNDLFPSLGLSRGDIGLHYCGVRPLPYVDARTPAAITRRHHLVWNDAAPVPLVSLVGGKLTTCRSLAEETAAAVLSRLGRPVQKNSRERPIPALPWDAHLARRDERPAAAPACDLPESAVREVIRSEWLTTLDDLVERRLLLHFHPGLSRRVLRQLAEWMVSEGKLAAAEADAAVQRVIERLRSHFGRRIE
jgi:glycerol-3-phosphate dehydrogenase